MLSRRHNLGGTGVVYTVTWRNVLLPFCLLDEYLTVTQYCTPTLVILCKGGVLLVGVGLDAHKRGSSQAIDIVRRPHQVAGVLYTVIYGSGFDVIFGAHCTTDHTHALRSTGKCFSVLS